MNQLLAGSQWRGCNFAKDDVTENTICHCLSHCLLSLFLGRRYFRNNDAHTHMRSAQIHTPQGICSQTSNAVTHKYPTHEYTYTHRHICLHAFVSRIFTVLWSWWRYWRCTGTQHSAISASTVTTRNGKILISSSTLWHIDLLQNRKQIHALFHCWVLSWSSLILLKLCVSY